MFAAQTGSTVSCHPRDPAGARFVQQEHVMSTDTTVRTPTAETDSSETLDRPRRPKRLLLIVLVALLAIVATLWFTGQLRPAPKLAIVTAGSGPYWDMVVRGA